MVSNRVLSKTGLKSDISERIKCTSGSNVVYYFIMFSSNIIFNLPLEFKFNSFLSVWL